MRVERCDAVPQKHRANSGGIEAEFRADTRKREAGLIDTDGYVDLARAHALRPLRRASPVEHLADGDPMDIVPSSDLLHRLARLIRSDDGLLCLRR